MPSKSILKELFTVIYAEKEIPIDRLFSLIHGECAVIVVKKFVESEVCDMISENFTKLETSRDIHDNVPGSYIGAYHYNKPLPKYFSEVESCKEKLEKLFFNSYNPVSKLHKYLTNEFQKTGITFRIAKYEDNISGTFVARKWYDTGSYLLKPHDDIPQLNSILQTNFEIQKVGNYYIIGSNICILNSNNRGELIIWNCINDDLEREKLGIAKTGYPYPVEYLYPFEKLVVKIEKGDLYFVNSSLVHAVNQQTNGNRITLSFLLGKINETSIVHWT